MNDHLTHGSLDGYVNHRCRCEPCKEAGCEYMRNYMYARFGQGRGREDPCTFDGCEVGSYAYGLCRAHHAQQWRGEELRPYTPKRRPRQAAG